MHENQRENFSFESRFDIDKLSFDNVDKEFEKKFRNSYDRSLDKMPDSKDPLTNASGANSLGILEKMAQQLSDYDENSDFEQSYNSILKEFEPFTET